MINIFLKKKKFSSECKAHILFIFIELIDTFTLCFDIREIYHLIVMQQIEIYKETKPKTHRYWNKFIIKPQSSYIFFIKN